MDLKTTNFTKKAVIGAMQIAIKNSGFFAYKMSVIVANSVAKNIIGRGLSFAANQTLTKSIYIFAGPIGWIISSGWFLIDIAGPAYRITIPATIYIASLRQAKLKKTFFEKKVCPNCQKSIPPDANFCFYCGEKL